MAEDGAEAPAPSVVAPAVAPSPVGEWPDFAVVCSFLERYGAALDLPELTFPELEEALEESGAVSKALVELHLKLMRKIGKSVTFDRWEKYLIKICQDYNSTWAWEMEKKGYLEMSVECKVGILKHLCECQFDDNLKFKNAINEEDADAMRLQPIGRDKDGLMYWYQLDQDHNIRMYIEEQDDQDGSTWKCIVRSRNELAETLELLKAQIDPALLKKSEPPDSSSRESPNPEDEDIKKEENGEKPADDADCLHIKEKADVLEQPKSENGNSFKTDGEKPLKTCSEIKTEPASDVKEETQTAKEENDSFKENVKPVIVEKKDEKAEPKDLKESKGNSDKTAPPQEPERSEISVIVKRTEEPVEKSVEDTGKMKNDQQAKIPLKKRELKLTDDFDSQVKASLCKSKTPTKELLQKEDGKPEDDGTKSTVGPCTAADGKQLVNGDLNSDKTHKIQDHAEKSSTPARESVIGSTKDESRKTNERNPSVIKSLQEVKENGKKSATEVSTDPITPSLEESSQKASVKLVPCEADLGKSSAEAKGGERKKAESVSDCDKEKQIEVKGDTSSSESVEKPNDLDKPVKVSPTDSSNVKEVSGKAEELVSETHCNDEEPGSDGRKAESESKTKDRKTKRNATARRRLPTSKRTSTKNSTLKPEQPSENTEKKDNELREEPEVPNDTVEENEKNANDAAALVNKSFTLRSKLKEKSSLKVGDTTEPSDSKEAENDQVDGTTTAEQEKTSEKPSLVSKNKHKLKSAQEDENSGPESKEMTSERQKDGIKLTIRISSKRRRAELPVENTAVEDVESDENIGRRLRRSPRISRPSVKVSEVKEQKPEKLESDEEAKPEPPKLEKESKTEREPSQKIKKKPRQRRRARWTNFRSRRRRKSSSEEETEESDSEDASEEGSGTEEKEDGAPGEEDDPCKKCGLPNHPELILLCDSCDSGYHTACLRPPLMLIPDGEWFCPPCQHKLLCEKLEEQLQNLDVVLKKRERAERRKERLVYVGISIENIIPTQEAEEVPEVQEKVEKKKKKPKPLERRSTRTRKFISYRFDEFDEAIDEAIEDDIRDADGGGGGGGRGKDMANITGHRGKDISTILEAEKTEGKRPQRAVTRRKKRRRLNDLDSDSNVDEEESEDEFQISEGSQDEFVVSEENPDESDDQQSNDSDFGTRRPRRHYRRPMRQSRRLKRRSVRRRYSDDDDDDDDETEEDAQATETEESSDYSDDYLDTRRRRSRRNQKRQVNYKEDSESDGSQKGARCGRGKEMRRVLKRRFSSSESNASDSSRASDEKPRNARKNLLRKRIRSSDDDLSEEEEEKPVRKRLNRIETDEEEEGDAKVCSDKKPPTEDKPPASSTIPESTKKPCYRIESDDDDFETVTKDGSPLDYSLVDLPSTNGQSPEKTIETLIGKPSEKSQTSKDTSATVSQASNGTGSSQEAVVPEEDEDELLRVTDLVDYVCNSEQL